VASVSKLSLDNQAFDMRRYKSPALVALAGEGGYSGSPPKYEYV